MMTTRIATCAFPGTYDVDKSVEMHLSYIEEAAAGGASLVVFPECSLQGYPADFRASDANASLEPFLKTVETVAEGPNVALIAEKAMERGVYVIYGLNEATDRPGVIYNSMVMTGPDGLVGVFRKVHVGITEQVFWRRGNDWPVYDTPFGKIGMLICYDKAWPEACRELTLRGADLLVMSTAWSLHNPVDGDDDVWVEQYKLYDRVRAVENSRWFISSNFVGELGGLHFFGLSQIVDPLGHVLATTGTSEAGLAFADVDIPGGILSAYALSQGPNIIRDRRPETYKALSGSVPITIDG
jgi:predicted amidohydrolase